MHFVQNFPFIGILLTLICAVVSSVLKPKAARAVTLCIIAAVTALTAGPLAYRDHGRKLRLHDGSLPCAVGQ